MIFRALARRLLLAALLLLPACGNDNPRLPQHIVTGLRVLGVRADPPEIRPLESSQLEILAVSTEGDELGFLWVACDPVFEVDIDSKPFSACQDESVLSGEDGAQALFTSGVARPLSFDLSATSVTYAPPVDATGAAVDIFASLAADDPRRQSGGSVTVVIIVAPLADLNALLADPDNATLVRERTEIVLKRITVSERTTPNRAPAIHALTVGAASHPPGTVIPFGSDPLPFVPELSSPEPFLYRHPDGTVTEELEQPVVSWYTTAGRFDEERSQLGEINAWTPPATGDTPPPPPSGTIPLWVVVRDGRGGAAWASFTLRR